MPKTEDIALNGKLKTYDDGSERQTEDTWWWLWTPKTEDMALNAKLKTYDDGSKSQTMEK